MVLSPTARHLVYCFNSVINIPEPFKWRRNFEQLTPHLQKAKKNGVTKAEIVEVITHLSFYAGWPKAWSAFNIAKQIYND
ncbi:carboxymuconolactone decarboxylase family protein [Priestia megaterium]|uniref:carboxymuconolactone decarboxylase family protein n=1 Tax=Priestia megaterium TaxID=1404 RepID=UPI002E22D6DA